jgi:hypothetical protein
VVVVESGAEAARLLDAPTAGGGGGRLRIWPLDRLAGGGGEGLAARQAAAVAALGGRAWLPCQLLRYAPKYEVRPRPAVALPAGRACCSAAVGSPR